MPLQVVVGSSQEKAHGQNPPGDGPTVAARSSERDRRLYMGEFSGGIAIIFVLWCVVVLLGYDKNGSKEAHSSDSLNSALRSPN